MNEYNTQDVCVHISIIHAGLSGST